MSFFQVLIDHKSNVNPIMRNSKGELLTPLDAALFKGDLFYDLKGYNYNYYFGKQRIFNEITVYLKEIEDVPNTSNCMEEFLPQSWPISMPYKKPYQSMFYILHMFYKFFRW